MKRPPSQRELRTFGFILSVGFLVIGLWPAVARHQSVRTWSVALASIFFGTGLVVPAFLRPAYRFWMTLGEILSRINSKIILGVFYYLVLTPIGKVIKITGRDPMNRRFDHKAETYRNPRTARPASHMNHQF